MLLVFFFLLWTSRNTGSFNGRVILLVRTALLGYLALLLSFCATIRAATCLD